MVIVHLCYVSLPKGIWFRLSVLIICMWRWTWDTWVAEGKIWFSSHQSASLCFGPEAVAKDSNLWSRPNQSKAIWNSPKQSEFLLTLRHPPLTSTSHLPIRTQKPPHFSMKAYHFPHLFSPKPSAPSISVSSVLDPSGATETSRITSTGGGAEASEVAQWYRDVARRCGATKAISCEEGRCEMHRDQPGVKQGSTL